LALALFFGAGGVAVKADDVAVMSPFEVAALSSEFANWTKTRSPHFVLYTDAGRKEAERILRQAEVRRWAEEQFFGRKMFRAAPRILVMPTQSSEWKELEVRSKVEWRVAVSNPAGELGALTVVAYDWQERGMSVFHGAIAEALLPGMELGGALWFDWGVKCFFETAEVTAGEVRLGRVNGARVAEVWRSRWLPWPRFFAVTPSSPEVVREGEVGRYEGQCAAFAHYFLSQADPAERRRFLLWRVRCPPGHEPTETEFKAVFEKDWKEWQGIMARHAANGRGTIATFPLGPEQKEIALESPDLRTREMRELFVLVQVLQQPGQAGEQALDSILARGLKTEELRRFVAEACVERERTRDALAQLRAMVAGGSDNPQVPIEAARLLWARSPAGITPDTRLGAEAAEIATLARRSLELEPRRREAAQFLAWSLALGAECTSRESAEIVEVATKMDPQLSREQVLGALAVALWRAGQEGQARQLTEGMKTSTGVGPVMRALAADVKRRLGPAHPPEPR